MLYTSAVSPAISVAPLAAPATGGVTLHVDITASGGTVSQATLNFPAAATLPLTFVYTAGSVIGSSYELVFSVTGVDDNHYLSPANFSITILARTTFNFNVSTLSLYAATTSSVIGITPGQAPATGGVSLQINTASSGGTTSLAQLDFPAALTLPLTFTYTAGQTLGSSYTLSFTVIGVDADHYYTPSPITITLIPSYFTFSPASDTLYTSALSSNISVTPSHAPFTGGIL